MSDSDPASLLDRARTTRAEAERLLKQASEMLAGDTSSVLIGMAKVLRRQATDLEQRAFNIAPPPAQTHANPQQMQQAQVTLAKPDDDQTPPRSD